MRIIKICKDIHNDIVINDGYVSHFHCQIMDDGSGHYKIADTGSTNGTFVNNMRIYGETPLSPTDVIRVGNTTLPWQSYFNNGHVSNGGSYGGRSYGGGGYNPTPNSGGIGMGITALSCGVVGLFLFPLILGIIATIFGGISMHRKERLKGLGIAGFVLGLVDIILGIIVIAAVGSIMWEL